MQHCVEFCIGVDTGGTYTDAVVLDGKRHVVASAKSLTTPWDLSVGLEAAIRAVLTSMPEAARREQVSLVCVSTTLATNAVVEARFSPICTLLIGFDEAMVEPSGLKRGAGGIIVRVGGGHDATGAEAEPLDEAAIAKASGQEALRATLASGDGQQHDEKESGFSAGRQDRAQPATGYATAGHHAQRDDPLNEGRDRAGQNRKKGIGKRGQKPFN